MVSYFLEVFLALSMHFGDTLRGFGKRVGATALVGAVCSAGVVPCFGDYVTFACVIADLTRWVKLLPVGSAMHLLDIDWVGRTGAGVMRLSTGCGRRWRSWCTSGGSRGLEELAGDPLCAIGGAGMIDVMAFSLHRASTSRRHAACTRAEMRFADFGAVADWPPGVGDRGLGRCDVEVTLLYLDAFVGRIRHVVPSPLLNQIVRQTRHQSAGHARCCQRSSSAWRAHRTPHNEIHARAGSQAGQRIPRYVCYLRWVK